MSIAPNLVVRKSQKSRFHLISCSLTRQSITFSRRVGYSCSVIRRLGLSMNDVNAYCVFLVRRIRPKTKTSCQKRRECVCCTYSYRVYWAQIYQNKKPLVLIISYFHWHCNSKWKLILWTQNFKTRPNQIIFPQFFMK